VSGWRMVQRRSNRCNDVNGLAANMLGVRRDVQCNLHRWAIENQKRITGTGGRYYAL
jgi:hypothetical protein